MVFPMVSQFHLTICCHEHGSFLPIDLRSCLGLVFPRLHVSSRRLCSELLFVFRLGVHSVHRFFLKAA
jgi:hypothetical protein